MRFLEFLQQLLMREREAIVERDEVGARKTLSMKRSNVCQPCGSEDQRLNALAECFGGVLLSEIYDDVSPKMRRTSQHCMARHATPLSVPDLSQVTEHLEGLTDCPEDLYLIEGDPQSFDDSVFSVDIGKSGGGENRRSSALFTFPGSAAVWSLRVKAVLKASMPSGKCFPNASPRFP